mgnify:CR=1 FL=1
MGGFRGFASDLCFLGGVQLRTLEFVDRKKVLWLFRQINNSKAKTMETEKVKQIKRQLERRGYKRYTKNLIGNEDYAYMKTTRNADGELKYIISHGFYDLGDYEGALENYGYTPTIVLGAAGSERIDVVLTEPEFSVEECEEIADKLAEFFKPYFEKYKIRKIY